jgi:diguanylate cyclase (GGDEF)-like protein
VHLAHHDPAFRDGAAGLLRAAGAEVSTAAERTAAAETVRRDHPHVVLLDLALAGAGHGSLLRDVAGDPELLGTAVVLLQPAASVDDVVRALESGAVDVWTGGVAPELIARVRAAYRSRLLLDLAMRRYADLEDLAYRDELTELPNRRGAGRQLDVLLSRARRHDEDLAILLIDADHFKAVNDNCGHVAGDVVLREIARRLRDRVRREDLVARWGGEEFLLAMPETSSEGAAIVAESLRRAIAETPIAADGQTLEITVSIGVAAWARDDCDDLIRRADSALYAAKAAGRDRVVVEPAERRAA